MAKKKKEKRGPNLSPLSLLRLRLDGLLHKSGWAARDAAAIYADLAAVIKDISPDHYLPIVIKAVNDADPTVHERLMELLPAWVEQMKTESVLAMLVEQGNLQPQESKLATTLLQACGLEVSPVSVDEEHAFHTAFYGADELGSQGFIIILWYANRQQSRVRGLNFLIDFNPPWDGAVKDVMTLPQRSPRDMVAQFVDIWRNNKVHIDIDELDAVAAKQRLIEALACNQAQNIRLPRDLVLVRDLFAQHVLALPDDADTPAFTLDDFDQMAQSGESAESITHIEQTVGRRVRLEDGKELIVMGDPFDDE
ncbi:MAG: hypothetical protein R3C14_42000 [Caldilineaceae bacterium]